MGNPITELLYEILIQTNRGSLDEAAKEAGYAYRTANEYCNDHRKTPPVEFLKAAWLVTEDPRLKRLLEPEGYELTPKAAARAHTGNWEREIGDINIAAANLLSIVREALTDDEIDRKEKIKIRRAVDMIKFELAQVEDIASSIVTRA